MDECKHLGNGAHERRGGRAGRTGGSGANAPAFLRFETPSGPGMGMTPRAIRRGRLRPSAGARGCDRGRNDAERLQPRTPACSTNFENAEIRARFQSGGDSSDRCARQSGMPSSTAEWAPRQRHSSSRARADAMPASERRRSSAAASTSESDAESNRTWKRILYRCVWTRGRRSIPASIPPADARAIPIRTLTALVFPPAPTRPLQASTLPR